MPRPEHLDKTRQVIDLIREGWTLTKALKEKDLVLKTFHNAISSVRELFQDYVTARKAAADILVDELVEIADREGLDPQRARNMLDTRKWIASKHNPQVYGERLEVNMNQSISISEALRDARARVPTIYQDAELIDDRPTLSIAPPGEVAANLPDIFG